MRRARTGRRGFLVLVATDGSAGARAALDAAVRFPWPRASRAAGVVGHEPAVARDAPQAVRQALARTLAAVADEAARALRGRWPRATVRRVERPAVEAILDEARRLGAGAIVVGSAGLGALGRLLVGSVSRAVVRRAGRTVLVVRGRPARVRRLVLGFDGSANAGRAVDLVARLVAPRGGRVTLVRAVKPERAAEHGVLPPRARAIVRERMRAVELEAVRRARAETATAAGRLARSGWRVQTRVRLGAALDTLLAAARGADALVVGARGAGRLRGLLVGSVAEGAVHRAPLSVLVVR